jgi:hypothetical protein
MPQGELCPGDNGLPGFRLGLKLDHVTENHFFIHKDAYFPAGPGKGLKKYPVQSQKIAFTRSGFILPA